LLSRRKLLSQITAVHDLHDRERPEDVQTRALRQSNPRAARVMAGM